MTLTEILMTEHRIFNRVFDQVEKTLPNLNTPQEGRLLAKLITGMLEAHAATETDLAYLALNHVLQNEGTLQRMFHDHQELDASLDRVQSATTCAEVCRLLKKAIQASREHFKAEELSVFPLMERKLQSETLTRLAETWKNAQPILQHQQARTAQAV